MKKNNIVPVVDFSVFVLTLIFGFYNLKKIVNPIGEIFANNTSVIVLAVLLIHTIKVFRLYFAMYGLNITAIGSLKTYCQVTPVSILLPFKAGELYRMYCYGRQIKSTLKGIVIILLDRFFDTAALVTMIVLVYRFANGKLNGLVWAMILFEIIIMLFYFVLPGFLRFWKKYLLDAKATEHKIWAIKVLDSIGVVYREIKGVITGRGIILYTLSLVSWIIEIVCLIVSEKEVESENISYKILEYLNASMGGKYNMALVRFGFISIIILVIVYMILRITERVRNTRRKVNENYYSL